MRGALGSPRVLLRRLREAMAEPVSAQARLDRIVVLIAANMVAEVCSVYVMQADGDLELFATEGLNREAVHRTLMKAGEGLVGLIAKEAQPLALSDAQQHPSYSYKPETGEEIYHAFLGVPILRAGDTLGVLVVQNRAHRVYTEEEVEALQTTAMVMAEIIASGEVAALIERGEQTAVGRPLHLKGSTLAEGIGLGHAVLHEPRVVVKNLIAEDPDREMERLETALDAVRANIDSLVERGGNHGQGEHLDILETIRMVAYDKGWLRRMREAVMTGITAEAAVERVQSDTRARLMRQTDPYVKERLHDLDDLANRLLHRLLGQGFGATKEELPDNAILVARSMAPAALLEYDSAKLRGLVLEEGGPTSHVAVVARALGIPAVGEIDNITGLVEPGDAVIVDGGVGDVQVRPRPDVEAAYAEKVRLRAKRLEQYRKLRDVAAVTKDGLEIALSINAGLVIDMPNLAETGASGVGLFRTELQFMVAARMPTASEQLALYKQVIDAAGDKPVVFRTLDIGGDKVLPYMKQVEEENPALGWRAIRIGLDRPVLLRAQLRALMRASGGRDLKIMFPMVAHVGEFERAKAIAAREIAYLERHGYALPQSIAYGVMLEVPSLLFQLEEIAERADFISVGSNDLMQFLFAADRENPQIAARFDTMSPAALRAFRMIAQTCLQLGTPITLCGEMGGRPLEAMTLTALGFRALSMSPASIGPVKAMVLKLDAGLLSNHLDELLRTKGHAESLRSDLQAFASLHGVPV